MLHKFRIDYTKYGNCATYQKSEEVQATSEKMAWKKFYNHRSYPKDRTRKQWMEYDLTANGISYGNFKITKLD